jgi:glycosyltransferase involved in cell wall biosynthesis
MTHAPRISVIVPVYNAEATLAETLDSALSQEEPVELIAIDDGSRDGSLDVARKFGSRLKLESGPNAGASVARNRGIAMATGDWIIFLDADDMLAPGTLAKRLETAATTGADVIVSDWREVDEVSTPIGDAVKAADWSRLNEDPEAACAEGVWATTAALMYRRSLVERICGFRLDLPVIQDARLMFDAAYDGARFAHSPHLGAYYRIVPNSLSRRNPEKFWLDVLKNGKQIEELWRRRGGLSQRQTEVLAGIYDVAARGLVKSSHPGYFEATSALKRLGTKLPLHPMLVEPLARLFGLNTASRLAGLLGR